MVQAIFDYVETWYNPHRRHGSLGYLSPVAFEAYQPSAPSAPKPMTVRYMGASPRSLRGGQRSPPEAQQPVPAGWRPRMASLNRTRKKYHPAPCPVNGYHPSSRPVAQWEFRHAVREWCTVCRCHADGRGDLQGARPRPDRLPGLGVHREHDRPRRPPVSSPSPPDPRLTRTGQGQSPVARSQLTPVNGYVDTHARTNDTPVYLCVY